MQLLETWQDPCSAMFSKSYCIKLSTSFWYPNLFILLGKWQKTGQIFVIIISKNLRILLSLFLILCEKHIVLLLLKSAELWLSSVFVKIQKANNDLPLHKNTVSEIFQQYSWLLCSYNEPCLVLKRRTGNNHDVHHGVVFSGAVFHYSIIFPQVHSGSDNTF